LKDVTTHVSQIVFCSNLMMRTAGHALFFTQMAKKPGLGRAEEASNAFFAGIKRPVYIKY
jgi:hypothetical protein